MAQTKITGLSARQQYDFLVSSYAKQIVDITKGYEGYFDQIINPEKDFWDYAAGTISLPFTVLYSAIKGGFEGITGLAQSVNILLTNFVNDAAHIFDNTDGTDWTTDINYALGNLVLTVGEGIAVSAIGLAANIGGLVGIDQSWAYGDDGLVDTVADYAMVGRNLILNNQSSSFASPDNVLMASAFTGNGNLDVAADVARERVDKRYYDATKSWIKGSVDVQNWVNKNFIIPPINEFLLGWAKNASDAAFGDQTWYQGLKGTSESIGNILASWGVAKLAGKIGLSTTGQQVASSSYFAGSIFGNSFKDAYENGASIQDAYTYAVGTAITETAIEQIGGFKPGEFAGENLFKFLTKPGTLRRILIEANQEGWEEVASQFLGTGMSYYSGGKNEVDQTQVKQGFDFLGDAFGAYLGGFASSFLLGGGTAIFSRNNVNTQVENIRQLFEKDVTEFGEEEAIKQLNARVQKLTDTLNKEKVRGVKFNKRGGTYTGVLTKAEIAEMLDLAGLERVVTFEPTMMDPEGALPARPMDNALERGFGTFVFDKNQKINKDFFKNKMTVSQKGVKSQVVVQEGVYAYNKATKGKDISNNGQVNVAAVQDLNDKGKKVLKQMENSKVPVVVYNGNANDSGFYSRKNGVIYVNQNSNATISEMMKETFIHETVHLISKNSPKQFNQLKKQVSELVEIKLNAKKDGLTVSFLNKKVQDYFKKRGIDLQKMLNDSFNEMVLPEKEGGQGLPIQQVLNNIQEEIVAYFVEAVAKDKSVLDLLKNTKVSLVERVSQFFEEKGKQKERFGEAAGAIGNIIETLKQGAKEGISREQKIGTYVDYVFGTNNLKNYLNPKIRGKFDEEEILEALVNGSYDAEKQTITLGGKEYKIWEVFNAAPAEGNLKRYIEKGTELYGAATGIYKTLKITEENAKQVIANLKKWYKQAEKKLNDDILPEDAKRELRTFVRAGEYVIEEIETAFKKGLPKQGFVFADNQETKIKPAIEGKLKKQFVAVALAELEISNKVVKEAKPTVVEDAGLSEEEKANKKAYKKTVADAAINILNRIIKRFNGENSAYQGLKRNVNTEQGQFSAELFKTIETVKTGEKRQSTEAQVEEVAKITKEVLALEVGRLYPPKVVAGINVETQFNVSSGVLIIPTYNGEKTDGYEIQVVLRITPTQQLIEATVKDIKEKAEGKTTKEAVAVEEVSPREKAYNMMIETTTELITTFVEKTKSMLKTVGIDFANFKVFSNTKGSSQGIFDASLKNAGIEAKQIEMPRAITAGETQKTPTIDRTSVPDAFGKKFIDFIQAMAERFPDSTEYNAMDAAEEGRKTPLGTFTISNATVFEGEYFLWAEYLEFIQIFPEYQNKGYEAYFDYIEKNPKWGEEATQKYVRGEKQPEAFNKDYKEEIKNFEEDYLSFYETDPYGLADGDDRVSNVYKDIYNDRHEGIIDALFFMLRDFKILKPEWKNKTNQDFFEYIEKWISSDFANEQERQAHIKEFKTEQKSWFSNPIVSEIINTKRGGLTPTSTVGEFRNRFQQPEKMSETERQTFIENVGDFFDNIKPAKAEVVLENSKKIIDALPERFRSRVFTVSASSYFSSGQSEKYQIQATDRYEIVETKEGTTYTSTDADFNTIDEFFDILEKMTPVGAKSALVSKQDIETAQETIKDVVFNMTSKIEKFFMDDVKGKERPDEPKEDSEIFTKNEDLISRIQDMNMSGYMVDGKEYNLFDSLLEYLEQYYIPVRTIDKVEDLLPELATAIETISDIYMDVSALLENFDEQTTNQQLFSERINIEAIKDVIENASDALKVFDISIKQEELIAELTPVEDQPTTQTQAPTLEIQPLAPLPELKVPAEEIAVPQEAEMILQEFSKDNMIIGMPLANAEEVVKAFDQAFKVSPIVAFVLPATWQKYKSQKELPANKKLIYSSFNGMQPVKTQEEGKPMQMKTVTQIWVDATDERFMDFEDLRKITPTKMETPDFDTTTLTGIKEDFEDLKARGVEFDFAVRSVGFNVDTDFNQILVGWEGIIPTQTYILVKANTAVNPQALEILKKIDFNQLAKTAPTLRLGFTAQDLVEEYIRVKNGQEKEPEFKRTTGRKALNEEQRKRIRALFDENVVRDFFEVDKSGKLVLTNERIKQKEYKTKAVSIKGVKYEDKKYAINVKQDLTKIDLNVDMDNREIVRIEDLDEDQLKVFQFLRSTNVNFVLYKVKKGGSSTGGFTFAQPGNTVVFVDLSQLKVKKFINEIITHEGFHQLFMYRKNEVLDMGEALADLLYDPATGKETELFKLINKAGFGGKFFEYMLSYARQDKNFRKIKTIKDVYDILKSRGNIQTNATGVAAQLLQTGQETVLEEVIAQIAGVLFTDQKFFEQALQSSDASAISFYQIYSQLTENVSIPKNLRDALRSLFNQVSQSIQNRLKDIEKLFPKAKTYTLKELNTFITTFTKGQFTTKAELINAYLEEKAQNKRGKASIALDNIIFIAKIFSGSVQQAVNNYEKLAQDFLNFKNNVDFIINNPEQALGGVKTDIFKIFTTIVNFPKAFSNLVAKQQKLFKEAKSPYPPAFGSKEAKKYNNASENMADYVSEAIDRLVSFYDAYQDLDDKLIALMGLPSKEEVGKEVDKLIKEYEKTLKSMEKNGAAYNSNMDMATKSFASILNAIAEAKKTFSPKSDNVLASLLKLVKQARDSRYQNITSTLERRLNDTINAIRNQPLQSKSPVNQNVRAIADIIAEVIKTFKRNRYDSANLLQELQPLLEQLYQFNKAQLLDKDGNPIGDALENGAPLVDFYKSILNIYLQLASLVGGKNPNKLLLKLPLSQADLIFIGVGEAANASKGTPEIDGKDVLTDPNYTKLPKFNEKSLANSFSTILRLFQTKYQTSLSSGKTHNEYAETIVLQIQKLKKSGFIAPKLNTANLTMEQVSKIMPPQDFFALFESVFGKNVTFFKDFFTEYTKAIFRRSDILQMFDIEYAQWIKTHKRNQEKSVRQEVELDTRYLVQMRAEDMGEINTKVKKEKETYSKELELIKTRIAKLKGDKRVIELKIKEKQAKVKTYKKNDRTRIRLINEITLLKNKKSELSAKISFANQEKVGLAKKKSSLSPELLTKLRVNEYTLKNKNKLKQSITRGQLVSLFLSVTREAEMHETVATGTAEEGIYPTEHFSFGNQVNMFDNELLKNKGYKLAKEREIAFTIMSEDRADLINYLKGLLSAEDLENIQFAKERFDRNYEWLDEIFFARFQVHLPRQNTYIPFATTTSNYERDFKLKQANRYNIAAPDGMVTATTAGTRTSLRIENIFSVIENHTQSTADYSFERLITDFQNLLVNKSAGVTLQTYLSGAGTIFGDSNGVIDTIERSLLNILKYSDITEGAVSKWVKGTLRNTVAATMSLNLKSAVKQLASITTIALKNGISVVDLLKNITLAQAPSKYRRWLMGVNPKTGKPNNSNFYWRAKIGNIPALAEQINTNLGSKIQTLFGKITQTLALPVGWLDNSVLVGTFASLVDKVKRDNPKISDEQAFEKANELFTEVLLFGVANTDTGFRSDYSNNRNVLQQMVSRYQSENIMQVSAMIRGSMMIKNKIGGGRRKLLRDLIAFLLSSIFAALVDSTYSQMSGQISEEDFLFEFALNDLLLGNILGAIPYVNLVTQMVEFDKEKVFLPTFEPTIPGLREVFDIVELSSSIINTDGDVSRKIVKIAEILGQMSGLPIRNGVRLFNDLSKLFAPKGAAMAVNRWYNQRTEAADFTQSVRNGDTEAINIYVSDKFGNGAVQREIARLLTKNKDLSLSLKDDTQFKAKNKKGETETYDIPERTKNKYDKMAHYALQILIRQTGYRKLSDKDKVAAIQRIINYYYNYMKAVITKEKDEITITQARSETEGVVARSLRYADED